VKKPLSDTTSQSRETHQALRWYDETKMRVARIGQMAMRVCTREGDSDGERAFQEILAALAEDRFNLAVVGPFSRGKSTLMNAILGVDTLPTGVLPHTSVVTTVTYGSRPRAIIRCEGWSFGQEISLAELPDYVSERGNPGNRRKVVTAEVQLPSALLRNGLSFVDTPGIGSAIAENTETTKRYLPEIDAAIFVSSFDSPLTADELDFLHRIRSAIGAAFFVLNKADLVSQADRAQVLKFVRERLSAVLGDSEHPLFPLSAKQALQAKLEDNADLLGDSGLPELEKSLAGFLASGKSRHLVGRALDRLIALLSERHTADAVATGKGLSAQDKGEILQRFERDLQRIKAEREKQTREALELVGPAIEQILPRLEKFFLDLKHDALKRFAKRLADPDTLSGTATFEQFAREVSSFCQEQLVRDCELSVIALATKFQAAAKGPLQQIGRLPAEIRRIASNAFGAELRQTSSSRDEANAFASDLETVVPGRIEWNPSLPWWIYAVPLGWFENRVRDAFATALDDLLARYRDSVEQIMRAKIERSVQEIGADAARKIDIVAARIRRHASNSGDCDPFGELLAEAIALRTSVTEPRGEAPGSVVHPSQEMEKGLLRECPVCGSTVRAMFDYLGKVQYELSENQRFQEEHTKRGGFCDFHTWTYASLASPQGISSAYPALLGSHSARLEHAAASAACSVDSIREQVSLIVSDSQCSACRFVGAIENRALEDALDSAVADDAVHYSLCLRHLHAALDRCPDAEAARRLVAATGRALTRDAENMRRYALKRDALRQDLVAPEERNAYLSGLSRLVGHKLLVRPSGEDA
jgi:GTP-binding protein EngB required for normal cell division